MTTQKSPPRPRQPLPVRILGIYILLIGLCICMISFIIPLMSVSAAYIPTRFMPVTGGGTAEIEGDSYTGTLGRREVHAWTVSGQPGQYLRIEFSDISDTNPRVHIFDPNGNLLTQELPFQNYDRFVYLYLESSGTYTIQIDMLRGNSYRFRIQEDN